MMGKIDPAATVERSNIVKPIVFVLTINAWEDKP